MLARDLSTANLHMAQDKHVVVIGSAKSAVDVAGAAAEVAASVTLLARNVRVLLRNPKLQKSQIQNRES